MVVDLGSLPLKRQVGGIDQRVSSTEVNEMKPTGYYLAKAYSVASSSKKNELIKN